MAFRSAFRDVVLPIPTRLPMIHDGWIALVISAVAEVVFIEEPLILYRQHEQQQIGAPMKRDVDQTDKLTKFQRIREAVNRPNPYRDLLMIIGAVRRRLDSRRDEFGRDTLGQLEEIEMHLSAGMRLPSNAFERLPVILRELLSLRYSRFSNGLASAAKVLSTPQSN